MTAGPGRNKDGDGAEVAEEHVEVVTYAAALDVAKGPGMVCTRVPGSRAGRKRQKVWQVDARRPPAMDRRSGRQGPQP